MPIIPDGLIEYKNNMSKMKGAIVVDTDLCIEACPQDVIIMVQKRVNVHGYPYVETGRPDTCTGCASCGIVCPDGCITVYRMKKED